MNGNNYTTITETDRTIGTLQWRYAPGDTVEIVDIIIHNMADRHKGYGTQLLKRAIKEIRETRPKPHAPLRLYAFTELSNAIAHSFYEARGFRRVVVIPDFYAFDDAVIYLKKEG